MLPFARFPGADPVLGPEMRATGEVMGLGGSFAEAFAKAQRGAGQALPRDGRGVHLGARRRQAAGGGAGRAPRPRRASSWWPPPARPRRWRPRASRCARCEKISEGPRRTSVDLIAGGEVALVVNTPRGGHGRADRRLRDPGRGDPRRHPVHHHHRGRPRPPPRPSPRPSARAPAAAGSGRPGGPASSGLPAGRSQTVFRLNLRARFSGTATVRRFACNKREKRVKRLQTRALPGRRTRTYDGPAMATTTPKTPIHRRPSARSISAWRPSAGRTRFVPAGRSSRRT